MYKWLTLIIAAFIIWKLLSGDSKRKKAKEAEEKEKMAASGELVKDPECGAYVAVDGDIRVREGETVHHFCSYECRDKFLKKLEAKQEIDGGGQDGASDERKSRGNLNTYRRDE